MLLLVKRQAEACTYKQGNDINQRLFDKIQQAPELLPVTLLLIKGNKISASINTSYGMHCIMYRANKQVYFAPLHIDILTFS